MGARIDLTGQVFHRLRVIKLDHINRHKQCMWLCRCRCGMRTVVASGALRSGGAKSCGCYKREQSRTRLTTHGQTGTPTFKIWKGLFTRCYNKKHHSYANYGGRGVRVCTRWKKFENFLKDMGPRPEGMSIDRLDVNGDYRPKNCRWATAFEQQHNKRTDVK